jgi:hypothetical protein
MNNDLVEMTTEETAATIAMPMPHLKKGQSSQATPPLAPRVDSAAASISNTGSGTIPASQLPHRAQSQRSGNDGGAVIGPSGTQQVMIGHSLDHLSEPRGGNLAAHPAGYYLPPGVQASLVRPQSQPTPVPGPSGLARTYDEPSSQSSDPSSGGQEVEGRTQVYRPRGDETARRARPSVPIKGKRSVPLLLVLLGFLLVGFVVVAGLMVLAKR